MFAALLRPQRQLQHTVVNDGETVFSSTESGFGRLRRISSSLYYTSYNNLEDKLCKNE